MRILVIDDDEHVARAIQRRLRGHDVEIEARAADAISRVDAASFDGHRFDVVICDFDMPGRSGGDVLAALRGFPDRPILILMSGYEDLGDARLAADAVMVKPFSVTELFATIDRIKALRPRTPTCRMLRPRACPGA